MSTSNIKIQDLKAYTEGYNKGFQAAEANRKLTSINASIVKSVFYQDYVKDFYTGVADGWQHSFDQKKQKVKSNAKEQVEQQKAQDTEKEARPNQQQMYEQQRQQRMQEAKQMQQQQRERDEQEVER